MEGKTFDVGEMVWLKRPNRSAIEGVVVDIGVGHDDGSYTVEHQEDKKTIRASYSRHFIYRRPSERDAVIAEFEEEIQVTEYRLRDFKRSSEPDEDEE